MVKLYFTATTKKNHKIEINVLTTNYLDSNFDSKNFDC